MRIRWVGVCAALGVAGALLVASFQRGDDASHADAERRPERLVTPGVSAAAAPIASEAFTREAPADELDDLVQRARGALPESLSGTAIDGGLSVDADGHFVADTDALALFHYFLAATGEEPDAVIRQRILDVIDARLAPPADAEAARFLDRYLDYRDALRALTEGGAAPVDLERRLQWLREIRRAHFGADAAALFGLEEELAIVDLERRRVLVDPDLDAEERAERLASLDARLPDTVRESRQRARAPTRVREEVERLREAGADPREVFAVREAAFGTEAAERLAALDAERAEFAARFEAYGVERDALLVELGFEGEAVGREPSAEVDERLEALRAEHFSEGEIARVRVLDGVR